MLADTIITAALRSLLVVPSGVSPTATQLADGLEVLNDGINMWSAQSNMIYEGKTYFGFFSKEDILATWKELGLDLSASSQ